MNSWSCKSYGVDSSWGFCTLQKLSMGCKLIFELGQGLIHFVMKVTTCFMEPEGSSMYVKNTLLYPIVRQMIPVHMLTPYFSKIHFNITTLYTPRIPKCFWPKLHTQFSFSPCVLCPAYCILLVSVTLTNYVKCTNDCTRLFHTIIIKTSIRPRVL